VGDLTSNFNAAEFDVHEPVPLHLIGNRDRVARLVQWLRDLANRPGTITSCYRSPARNRAVGGAPASAHLEAKAADVVFAGISKRELIRRALESIHAGHAPADLGLLMIYDSTSHVHVGLTRPGYAKMRILRRPLAGPELVVTRAEDVPDPKS
jgi:hypothetical protein